MGIYCASSLLKCTYSTVVPSKTLAPAGADIKPWPRPGQTLNPGQNCCSGRSLNCMAKEYYLTLSSFITEAVRNNATFQALLTYRFEEIVTADHILRTLGNTLKREKTFTKLAQVILRRIAIANCPAFMAMQKLIHQLTQIQLNTNTVLYVSMIPENSNFMRVMKKLNFLR